jgi:hypothetical protein
MARTIEGERNPGQGKLSLTGDHPMDTVASVKEAIPNPAGNFGHGPARKPGGLQRRFDRPMIHVVLRMENIRSRGHS